MLFHTLDLEDRDSNGLPHLGLPRWWRPKDEERSRGILLRWILRRLPERRREETARDGLDDIG